MPWHEKVVFAACTMAFGAMLYFLPSRKQATMHVCNAFPSTPRYGQYVLLLHHKTMPSGIYCYTGSWELQGHLKEAVCADSGAKWICKPTGWMREPQRADEVYMDHSHVNHLEVSQGTGRTSVQHWFSEDTCITKSSFTIVHKPVHVVLSDVSHKVILQHGADVKSDFYWNGKHHDVPGSSLVTVSRTQLAWEPLDNPSCTE